MKSTADPTPSAFTIDAFTNATSTFNAMTPIPTLTAITTGATTAHTTAGTHEDATITVTVTAPSETMTTIATVTTIATATCMTMITTVIVVTANKIAITPATIAHAIVAVTKTRSHTSLNTRPRTFVSKSPTPPRTLTTRSWEISFDRCTDFQFMMQSTPPCMRSASAGSLTLLRT